MPTGLEAEGANNTSTPEPQIATIINAREGGAGFNDPDKISAGYQVDPANTAEIRRQEEVQERIEALNSTEMLGQGEMSKEISAIEQSAEEISPDLGENIRKEIDLTMAEKVKLFFYEQATKIQQWYGNKKTEKIVGEILKVSPNDSFGMKRDLQRINEEIAEGKTQVKYISGDQAGHGQRVEIKMDPQAQRLEDPETYKVLMNAQTAARAEVGGSYVNYALQELREKLSASIELTRSRKQTVESVKSRVLQYGNGLQQPIHA